MRGIGAGLPMIALRSISEAAADLHELGSRPVLTDAQESSILDCGARGLEIIHNVNFLTPLAGPRDEYKIFARRRR